MDNLHPVQMLQTSRHLDQSLFAIQRGGQLHVLIGAGYEVGQRGWAEIECNIEEVVAAFLTIIANDVWVIIARLEQPGFLARETREVRQ